MSALTQLTALRADFSPAAEPRVARLLERLASTRLRDQQQLIHLHEAALFFRAHPHSPRIARLADVILRKFAARLKGLDLLPFEAAEAAGIDCTAISTNYSHAFAEFLSDWHGENLKIDWENFAHPERLGPVLARVAPMAAEDWMVEPHIDWRRWFEVLGGTLPALLGSLDPLVYDTLELPLLFEIRGSASRTLARLPRRETFYHREPMLRRRDVSLANELAGGRIATRRLKRGDAEDVLQVAVNTSAVRYRELWGFCYPDTRRMLHVDLGRGVDLYWWGASPDARLPLRAYHCGLFFKNGVPLGYVETLSFFDRMEVGFNLYYTFREGESAWLYARLLAFCRQQTGVTCFSIDPYQLGHENEEAIASGAFWFYRKLGFSSASVEIQRLVEREEKKLATSKTYRTPAAMLRKLAKAPLLYGSTKDDWRGFCLRKFAQGVGMGEPWPEDLREQIETAKQSLDETRYLRLLHKSPHLRAHVLKHGNC
jgi:hypothetical protein